eukprot:2796183-Prorocentrum_lima.AAC.1
MECGKEGKEGGETTKENLIEIVEAELEDLPDLVLEEDGQLHAERLDGVGMMMSEVDGYGGIAKGVLRKLRREEDVGTPAHVL